MAFNKDVTFYLYTWFQLVLSRKVKWRAALLFSLEILSFIRCICNFFKKTAPSHLAVRKFWNMTPHPCRTPSKQRRVQCKDRILWAENGLKGAETRRAAVSSHMRALRDSSLLFFFPRLARQRQMLLSDSWTSRWMEVCVLLWHVSESKPNSMSLWYLDMSNMTCLNALLGGVC